MMRVQLEQGNDQVIRDIVRIQQKIHRLKQVLFQDEVNESHRNVQHVAHQYHKTIESIHTKNTLRLYY